MSIVLIMNLRRQLEEIHVLQCSLLPPEAFDFVLPPSDREQWTNLLHQFSDEGTVPDDVWQPASTCRFEVRVQRIPIRFEIELPRQYPERAEPLIYVRGDSIQRVEQERWQSVVKERLSSLKEEGVQFIVQTLLCLYLIPLLHEEVQAVQSPCPSSPAPLSSPSSVKNTIQKSTQVTLSETYHVLFTSHHLISPTKRRNLQKWSGELSLHGFAKVGYPGVIYAEGSRTDVEEFVSRIKAMQWLALKVRFEQRLEVEKHGKLRLGPDDGERRADRYEKHSGRGKSKWVEVEKVGQVVEMMHLSGREVFVTEMGLGSGTSTSGS